MTWLLRVYDFFAAHRRYLWCGVCAVLVPLLILAVILRYNEDIMDFLPVTPEEREQLGKMIKDSSKTITNLIDEMAELSLYESKKSLPTNYTMSPNLVCRHMVDTMRPLCKEGVRIYCETELPDDYEVPTNLEAMQSLLKHLIGNAVQFTDKGVITVGCTEYGENIRISVTDTGRGIPPERREHVFETFREIGDNQQLQGLGLAICQAIIKLLGGKIWLDDDYTNGSRFIFEVPKRTK